uniref:Rhodopsin domain-containing protein n=1 Tax=Bionectria ochroleuca TaxID=29856 RepID=A0A8H7KEK0_BIOOC
MSDATSTSVIAGEWTLLSLALVLVAARVFARIHLNKDKLHLADIFLLVASACALALVVCDTLVYNVGTMHNYEDPGTYTLLIRFTVNYWFDFGMYFPKFSIISFYYTLVPRTQPRMRQALYGLTAITVASSLVTFFDATLWCGTNIKSNWSEAPDACRAYDSMVMMRIHWSLNFTTEVLNVVFPFPLIRDLKLPKFREKVGLAAILGLGIITIAVSIGRFVNMAVGGNGFSNYLWATSELCVSIMVVALTALRPLLRKIARLINATNSNSDYKYGGTSAGLHTKTGRSKPTHTQGSGVYWRTYSGPGTTKDGADESDVELHGIKTKNHVIKTEEIQISTEDASPEHSKKPLGTEFIQPEAHKPANPANAGNTRSSNRVKKFSLENKVTKSYTRKITSKRNQLVNGEALVQGQLALNQLLRDEIARLAQLLDRYHKTLLTSEANEDAEERVAALGGPSFGPIPSSKSNRRSSST